MINATLHRTLVQSQTDPVNRNLPSWPVWSIGLMVLASNVLPIGATYAMHGVLLIFAMMYWAASHEKLDGNLLRGILPFGLIIVIGLVSGYGANAYLYMKDAWYASSAAIYLTSGYVLYRCRPSLALGLRAFVVAGTIIALFKLSTFVANPELLRLSAASIREQVGYGSPAPLLALAILFAYFGRWRDGLKLPSWIAVGCLLVCGLSVAVSFSRQGLLITTIGILAAVGIFARRELLRFGVIALIGAAALVALRGSLDVDVNSYQGTFLGKLARAPEELLIRDYADRSSIQANWRGYETSQALRVYASGTPFELFLGKGFGHSLDLGLFINLGGSTPGVRERINSAPILHNGFAFLLLKTGPIAIALYAYAIVWLYMVGRKQAASTQFILAAPSRLMQAIALIGAISTWVSMGTITGGIYVLASGYLLAALTRRAESPPV